MKRRNFIKKSMQVGAALSLPLSVSGFGMKAVGKMKIGIVADVHQDVIHDGLARLRFFMDDMKKRNPDFILQMGDFAMPHSFNQPFLDVWNEFEGPKYHILGNHDTDHGYSKEQTMAWWKMEKRYYSFDQGGFHFIVLDGNEENPKPWSGYNRYIGQEQIEWLRADLEKTSRPTIVFVHQSLEIPSGGVANHKEIRAVLEQAKISGDQSKVVACLSGHHHTDYVKEINGIPYIQINSMSYKWVGGKYEQKRFPEHIEEAYPYLKMTCPYKDPLYTVLTLDPTAGTMHLEGRETSFISPTPKELEIPDAEKMHPTITERSLNFLE
jgi:predicted phosphodiesterase